MKKKFKFTRYVWILYVAIAAIGISFLLTHHHGFQNQNWFSYEEQSGTKEPYVKSTVEKANNNVQQETVSVQPSKEVTQPSKQNSQQTTQPTTKSNDDKNKESELASELDSLVKETADKETADKKTADKEVTNQETAEPVEDITEASQEESNVELTTTPGVSYSVTISGASFVNIRMSDVSKAKTVGVAKNGDQGILIEAGKYCSLIEVNGIRGYVYNKYISINQR